MKLWCKWLLTDTLNLSLHCFANQDANVQQSDQKPSKVYDEYEWKQWLLYPNILQGCGSVGYVLLQMTSAVLKSHLQSSHLPMTVTFQAVIIANFQSQLQVQRFRQIALEAT